MNGLSDSEVQHEQPTETTALLVHGTARRIPERHTLPYVEPAIHQIQAKGYNSCAAADWCPYSLSSRAAETAFSLVVLLELRTLLTSRKSRTRNVWAQWSHEERDAGTLRDLDHQISHIWTEFVGDEHSVEEIEIVLWHTFPHSETNQRLLRVVDYLSKHDVPQDLLTHRIVILSLLKIWRYGFSNHSPGSSIFSRLLERIDAVCTPRVLHAIDFSSWLIYIAIFAHFLVIPPSKPVDPTSRLPNRREALLMLYSTSKVSQAWSLSTIPFLLVLLAFIVCLPSVPFPDDFAYSVLLLAFSWNIVELHLPRNPGPLYFLPFDYILPLAVLIWHGILRIFFPVITFFLPALILSIFLLSTSLLDMFPNVFTLAHYGPAPMETRIAFLSLFCVMLLLLLSSLIMLVLVYPSLSANTLQPNMWDRYSKLVGLDARRAFIRAVTAYSVPYSFPPPFNLLYSIIVGLPVSLMMLAQGKGGDQRLHLVQRILWRVTIVPIAMVVAGFWLWGLRG